MKFKDYIHLPTVAELFEIGKAGAKNGRDDVFNALILESWAGRSAMVSSDLADNKRADHHADNPLLDRSQGSDFYSTRSRDDRAQELDFDR